MLFKQGIYYLSLVFKSPFPGLHINVSVQLRGSLIMPDETVHRAAPYDVIYYRQLRIEEGSIEEEQFFLCRYATSTAVTIILSGAEEYRTAVEACEESSNH